VREDIVARCHFGEYAKVLSALTDTGKTKLELVSEVYAAGELASRFVGLYAVRIER